MNITENKAIIEQVNQAFARQDSATILTYFAPDAAWEMIGQGRAEGIEAITKFMNQMPPMPEMSFTVDPVTAEDDRVVCRGKLLNKNADGSPWKGVYTDHYQLRDGKIIEMVSFVMETK